LWRLSVVACLLVGQTSADNWQPHWVLWRKIFMSAKSSGRFLSWPSKEGNKNVIKNKVYTHKFCLTFAGNAKTLVCCFVAVAAPYKFQMK